MSQPLDYRIIRGSLKMPRAQRSNPKLSSFYQQGDMVPRGVYSEAELRVMEEDGRIEAFTATDREVAIERQVVEARGKWTVNPATIADKSLEELRILVTEIDPAIDVSSIESVEVAVRFLSQNWRPVVEQPVPVASDRTRPEAMSAKTMEQKGGPVIQTTSGKAAPSALDAARAKAQAPSDD